VSSEAIATLASLEHLQEFLYFRSHMANQPALSTRNKELYSLCLQLLPRLQISCSSIKIEQECDFYQAESSWKSFQDLQGRLPRRLGLRQLTLHDADEMPVGVALPHLTTLRLIVPREHFRLGCHFARLRELGLISVKQQLLQNILEEVGRQLLKLSVSVLDVLHVDNVFHLCPKLQTFCVFGFPLYMMGVSAPEDDYTLATLTELRLVMQNDGDWNSSMQHDHLLLVLRALPNLRVLRLKNVVFDQHDELLFGAALKKGELLQHLETLSCCYEWLNEQVQMRMRGLLQTSHAVFCHVLDNCPELCDVKVRTLE
jgi:hypothetical protein